MGLASLRKVGQGPIKKITKRLFEAQLIKITIKEKYKVRCTYMEQDKLYKIFSKAKATVVEQSIENECTFTIEFEKEKEIELTKILSEQGIYFIKLD